MLGHLVFGGHGTDHAGGGILAPLEVPSSSPATGDKLFPYPRSPDPSLANKDREVSACIPEDLAPLPPLP